MANAKKMDCVILGLLSHEPLTGYEIKQRIDTTLKFFWSGSFGSIYPTLNALEKEHKVTKEDVSTNGREKIKYTITKEGIDFLHEWLRKEVEKDELRYETLLKLFFGKENGLDGTYEHIERFEEKIKAGLPFLKMSVEQLSTILDLDETHKYYMLTAMFGVKTYETYLAWCEEAKTLIRQWQKK